jgi:aspartate ammonia-lyase
MPAPKNPLSSIAFFEDLPDQLLWHLNQISEEVTHAPDDRLFRAGDTRKAIWLILDGTLAIEAPFGDIPTRYATLGHGDIIGESLLLGDETHHTEGRVIQPLKALRFDRNALEPILKDQPRLYAALLQRSAKVIAKRLKQADATLSGRDPITAGGNTRKEHDLLGERDVPQSALFGVQTLRAIENFPITGVTLRYFPELIIALAQVKQAAALANKELGKLDPGQLYIIFWD